MWNLLAVHLPLRKITRKVKNRFWQLLKRWMSESWTDVYILWIQTDIHRYKLLHRPCHVTAAVALCKVQTEIVGGKRWAEENQRGFDCLSLNQSGLVSWLFRFTFHLGVLGCWSLTETCVTWLKVNHLCLISPPFSLNPIKPIFTPHFRHWPYEIPNLFPQSQFFIHAQMTLTYHLDFKASTHSNSLWWRATWHLWETKLLK